MDDNETANLDLEFKRYLQLLRPYLEQLIDKKVIKICDSWIQRLSDCKDDEKALRNKYVFLLCYQLAKGFLDTPFLNRPPSELSPLSDDLHSEESSTEVEYVVINSDVEPRTKVIFDSKKVAISETDYLSQEFDKITESLTSSEIPLNAFPNCTNPKFLCLNCPELLQKYVGHGEEYECRANNLIKKLREIKMQNILLQRELDALKEEARGKNEDCTCECIPKVDNATSAYIKNNDSNITLRSLKCQLQEVQDSRNTMIQTISNLHDQLDHMNELKKNEIEEIEAKHRLEIIKVRTAAREEMKEYYEKKFDELRLTYEDTINKVQDTATTESQELTKSKDEMINERNKLLEIKDAEIARLKAQVEEQKNNLNTMLNKFIEKSNEDLSNDTMRFKAQQLEKRLNKMEKSKVKCIKLYEAKLDQLQREKHLAECTLQLQLVRQRAQVVNEMTDENQTELNSSLDKLETKYKDIVANVQATAIQRRMQDQLALESIFQAACGIHEQNLMPNSYTKQARNQNQSYDSEISSIMRGNKVGNVIAGNNKSYGEDSLGAGYCLNGERMGELFERVYIPQRDNGEAK
ncbi:putative leucine-rich repeat-containing protein DDB_G0290503 [Trichoplusia ni]|uniref:Leucine-rich repeat-containing protein DDB_G0290503 n=1 Tax=Trichoplusia ni TaxID=7111 RepID=A0A7E5WFB4_TRINI|nr:putative leucine-rich repeat-containing protein DDB_G0290503 [Trichoplusia ni]